MQQIRLATREDYDAVWDIFKKVILTGDTYAYLPDTPKKDLAKYWFAPDMHSYVLEDNNQILGTYVLKPNKPGLAAHVANGSYMVHPKAQGKGIGKLLCEHSLQTAKKLGFKAMQFNLVVSTNEPAVKLWQKYGFEIIGTIPNGFNHMQLGYVDAYIMYKNLD